MLGFSPIAGAPISGFLTHLGFTTYTYSSSGGIVFGGTATYSQVGVVYTYSGSGSLTFAGAGLYNQAYTFSYSASGGIIFAGEALLAKVKSAVVSGGITFSGTAANEKLFIYPYRIPDYFTLGHDNKKRRGWSI